MSEQPVSGQRDESAQAADRSALAEDDIDFAEAFKRATGHCPLGAAQLGGKQPDSADSNGEAPEDDNPA